MNSRWWRWGPLLGLLGATACSGGPETPETARFEIKAAALTLTGISNALYTIHVENQQGDVVFDVAIDSEQFGDGKGSATYVGPCDASAGANPNIISLTLDGLVDSNGDAVLDSEWVQPPTMVQEIDCAENADTLVEFNVTVARDAEQGWFDIAVNFEDIFCSAKLDCQDELLHNADGERDLTAVVAFACTAGPGQDTTLYWGKSAIVCQEGEVTRRYELNPGAGEGQHGSITSPRNPKMTEDPGVYQWANYITEEQLPGIDKCSWVTAIGLDLANLGNNCVFEATATASDSPFTAPYMHSPAHTIYPVIRWKVKLTDDRGGLLCGNNPLNGADSGVQTEYSDFAGEQFQVGAACGGEPFFNHLACTGTAEGADALTFAPSGEGQVTVAYGGQTFGPFALPEGTNFDVGSGECCVEPCCEEAE